jgi:hypothetical protein
MSKFNANFCACRGQKALDPTVKFFDICPVCGWEDDPIKNKHPDDDGGANHISLNTAKKAYNGGKDIHALKDAAMERYNETLNREAITATENAAKAPA